MLSKDLDEGLKIFFDVLRNPEFREAPLNLAKARLIEELRQANDQPSEILSREYEKLLYGDHPLTWRPTKATYEGVTAADLKAFHDQYFVPGNIILAASGDFAKADLLARIEKEAAGWENRKVAVPAIPAEFPKPEPGVYFVQKQINQGYISLGHLGFEDTNPDYYAVQVMNFILGGGSFTSRITTKVRSDEGLSYNQGSRFMYRWGFPGTFSGFVQTKSSTVGYAISLIENEIDRIRTQPVSDAEMETAVNYYLESFSSGFESPAGDHGRLRRAGDDRQADGLLQEVPRPHPRRDQGPGAGSGQQVHPSGPVRRPDRRRLGALQRRRRQVARPAGQAGPGPPDPAGRSHDRRGPGRGPEDRNPSKLNR